MSQPYNLSPPSMARSSSAISTQRAVATSTLNTSSAFSPHAYPNEDWTKISDLAERRRIQNRIAQRNYRQKLKRRMEDLERRAYSPSRSTSPESTPAAASSPPAPKQKQKQKQPTPQRPVHIKAKSHGSLPTQSTWANAHSPTPSLRNSTSSFDEEATLARFGYGLPSPALERTALASTASSYAMHEPQHLTSTEYAQEPCYEFLPSTSVSAGYGSTYSAWNSTMYGADGMARGHGPAQSVPAHVKQEQMDDDDMHGFGLNSYHTIPLSSSATVSNSRAAPYALSGTQSYTPSLSDSHDDSFSFTSSTFLDSPHFDTNFDASPFDASPFDANPFDASPFNAKGFGTYPTPPASVTAELDADDTFFSVALAQALGAEEVGLPLFGTEELEMGMGMGMGMGEFEMGLGLGL